MTKLRYTSKILSKKKTIDIIFIVTKITIIGFVSLWLIGNFLPFFNGADSKLYGVSAIDLANGEFGFTNELLQQTGKWQFIPGQSVKTIYNTAIPIGGFGIYGLSAVAYSVAGLNGLFYLGPVMSIILLISSERIATNLFGRGAGLATLLLIATDFAILNGGIRLLTDNIFALFFVLGCFFLIKFLRNKKNLYIFLCSSFFSICALFRLTGVISFPIELSLIIGYIIITGVIFRKNKFIEKKILKNLKQIIFTKNFVIKSSLFIIPWILFFIFLFSFNTYFFGDPFTTYNDVSPYEKKLKESSRLSFFTFDQDRFEWIKFYLTGFIPDEILQKVQHISSDDHSWNFKLNWMGGISLLIFVSGLVIAVKEKTNRSDIIILILFALSFPLIYSLDTLHDNEYFETDPSFKTGERYMIPSYIMLSLIFGFIIQKIWDICFKNNSTFSLKKSLAFKSIFIVIFFTFFLFSFYDSLPGISLSTQHLLLKNPNQERFINWIPTDLKELPSDSIVLGTKIRRAIEGDVILFNANYGIGDWKNRTNTPLESIEILKDAMNSGYDVYTFTQKKHRVEGPYFQYLMNEHDFVFTQVSKTFCKLELINETSIKTKNFTNVESDQICITAKSKEPADIYSPFYVKVN